MELDQADVKFLAARLRRLFKHFDYPLPGIAANNDESLIRMAGSCIGGVLTKIDQPAIWERFVNRRVKRDGTVWVYGTEAQMAEALGADHGFHKTSLAASTACGIDYKLPDGAAELKELLS